MYTVFTLAAFCSRASLELEEEREEGGEEETLLFFCLLKQFTGRKR